jgi:hypothetical protein
LVENSNSAALRMASRMLGFRVMAFAFRSRLFVRLYKISGLVNKHLGARAAPTDWTR